MTEEFIRRKLRDHLAAACGADIEITDVFDLHTIPPRDVKRVVEEYLFLAREKGFQSIRIIHGKGIGVQRETVRSRTAPTNSGGAAAGGQSSAT